MGSEGLFALSRVQELETIIRDCLYGEPLYTVEGGFDDGKIVRDEDGLNHYPDLKEIRKKLESSGVKE